jgi:hypothetical protein
MITAQPAKSTSASSSARSAPESWRRTLLEQERHVFHGRGADALARDGKDDGPDAGQKVAMTDESGFHYDCRCDRLYARRWTTDYRVWAGRQNSRGIDTRRVGTTKQRSFHQMT